MAARSIGFDGLHEPERRVLDAWDGGATTHQIAADTGMSSRDVGKMISRFSDSGETRAFDAMVRTASARLAAACVATGRGFV